MNWRTEVINDTRFKEQLDRLPEGTDILYAETKIALQASLLLGGYHFGAIAYPMLAGSASLERVINERKPAVIVTPAFRALNSLAERRAKNFEPRRHGFLLEVVDRIQVRTDPPRSMREFYLLIDNPGPVLVLRAVVKGAPISRIISEKDVHVPAGFSGWMRALSDLPPGSTHITFSLPYRDVWILGMAAEPPRPHVRWPWLSGLHINYHFRGRPESTSVMLKFSAGSVLAEWGAEELEAYVDKGESVLSDDGGLVFLRTRF